MKNQISLNLPPGAKVTRPHRIEVKEIKQFEYNDDTGMLTIEEPGGDCYFGYDIVAKPTIWQRMLSIFHNIWQRVRNIFCQNNKEKF